MLSKKVIKKRDQLLVEIMKIEDAWDRYIAAKTVADQLESFAVARNPNLGQKHTPRPEDYPYMDV